MYCHPSLTELILLVPNDSFWLLILPSKNFCCFPVLVSHDINLPWCHSFYFASLNSVNSFCTIWRYKYSFYTCFYALVNAQDWWKAEVPFLFPVRHNTKSSCFVLHTWAEVYMRKNNCHLPWVGKVAVTKGNILSCLSWLNAAGLWHGARWWCAAPWHKSVWSWCPGAQAYEPHSL